MYRIRLLRQASEVEARKGVRFFAVQGGSASNIKYVKVGKYQIPARLVDRWRKKQERLRVHTSDSHDLSQASKLSFSYSQLEAMSCEEVFSNILKLLAAHGTVRPSFLSLLCKKTATVDDFLLCLAAATQTHHLSSPPLPPQNYLLDLVSAALRTQSLPLLLAHPRFLPSSAYAALLTSVSLQQWAEWTQQGDVTDLVPEKKAWKVLETLTQGEGSEEQIGSVVKRMAESSAQSQSQEKKVASAVVKGGLRMGVGAEYGDARVRELVRRSAEALLPGDQEAAAYRQRSVKGDATLAAVALLATQNERSCVDLVGDVTRAYQSSATAKQWIPLLQLAVATPEGSEVRRHTVELVNAAALSDAAGVKEWLHPEKDIEGNEEGQEAANLAAALFEAEAQAQAQTNAEDETADSSTKE